MARDPDIELQPNIPDSVAATKPDDVEKVTANTSPDGATADQGEDLQQIDIKYWLTCLDDAERAERDWRQYGRKVSEIYLNAQKAATASRSSGVGGVEFNILYANTEVTLPAIYQTPPQPVVRARFTAPDAGAMQPPMPMMPPGLPPEIAAGPGVAGPNAGAPLPTDLPVGAPPIPGAMPQGQPGNGAGPVLTAVNGLDPMLQGMPAPGMPQPGPLPGVGATYPGGSPKPLQTDIETAASVMEKALEIVVEDEHSNEAVKAAIKDVLLPGRGTCRVRWRPQVVSEPVMAGDGTTPLPASPLPGMGHNGGPPMQDRKVWEEVGDEYVYWQDLLIDPVRSSSDQAWIAFRHLFAEKALIAEFQGSPEFDKFVAAGKVGELLKWTDESAAKSPVGGGSAMKADSNKGDVIRKAMVWEIWDKVNRKVYWIIREAGGVPLRVDPDILQLQGFFPIPIPMLAVHTNDSRIPKPFYALYEKLADTLDDTWRRINRLTKQIKVRGAYNSSSKDIADILTAGDNKMIAVDGVDMLNGGLNNHIWLVPVNIFVQALKELYNSAEMLKQAIYEIMGISDIMRGATKASETATAQRIKGSMGMVRLEDQKQQAANFSRDLLRLKGEIIAQHFDADTLAKMTGEDVTPEVMAILRNDFQRTCLIDIESDSTVAADEQMEQQSMAQIMMALQQVMAGVQGMLQTGLLPPNQVIMLGLELMKMVLHSVRHSRGVVELINGFMDQLQMMAAQQPMMPPMIPPGPEAGGPPGGEPSQAAPGGGTTNGSGYGELAGALQ